MLKLHYYPITAKPLGVKASYPVWRAAAVDKIHIVSGIGYAMLGAAAYALNYALLGD